MRMALEYYTHKKILPYLNMARNSGHIFSYILIYQKIQITKNLYSYYVKDTLLNNTYKTHTHS